jgi:hypothetical protein
MHVTPHVAQHTTGRRSAIDARTTRHPGYAISQQKRKRVEQGFGWMKTIGGLRKLRHRGGPLVDWVFTFTAAVYIIGGCYDCWKRPCDARHARAAAGSAIDGDRGIGRFHKETVTMQVTISAAC